MWLRASAIIVLLVKGKIHLATIFFFELSIFIVDMEVRIHFLYIGLLWKLQGGHFLLLKAYFGSRLVFKLEFHLLYLKDPLGINGLDLSLHQLIEQYVFSRYAFLEEVFKIPFIFLNIVVLLPGRGALGRIEYGLRVSWIIVEFGENGFLLVLALVFAVGAGHALPLDGFLLLVYTHRD